MASGVAFRDLPVEAQARWKLIDFGAARFVNKIKQKGDGLGTPSYFAPERVRGYVGTGCGGRELDKIDPLFILRDGLSKTGAYFFLIFSRNLHQIAGAWGRGARGGRRRAIFF